MKRYYLFFVAVFALSLGVNAQLIEDSFETYALGDMSLQNPSVWTTWSGFPDNGTNITVVNDIVGSGIQSGYFGPFAQTDFQDCLLLLGNLTSGKHIVTFDMFVSSGSTAYFDVQGETEENSMTGYHGAYNTNNAGGTTGMWVSGNLFFNKGALEPGVFRDDLTNETAFYPEDAWFLVAVYVDLDALTYEIAIDGAMVHAAPVPFYEGAVLGAINFFSIDENTNFWIDNAYYEEDRTAGIDDFSFTNFKIYPNPVQDVLNIRTSVSIDEIAVYDVLGKLVQATTPKTISTTLDMSFLNSGVYLVKVTIGGTSKIVKIIK